MPWIRWCSALSIPEVYWFHGVKITRGASYVSQVSTSLCKQVERRWISTWCSLTVAVSLLRRTKALVLELLAAVCLVRGGHEIILSAFDNFKEVRYSAWLELGVCVSSSLTWRWLELSHSAELLRVGIALKLWIFRTPRWAAKNQTVVWTPSFCALFFKRAVIPTRWTQAVNCSLHLLGSRAVAPKWWRSWELYSRSSVFEHFCTFLDKATRNGVLDLPFSEPFTQALETQSAWFYYQ